MFVGAFSGIINVLMLSGSLYMLQIYDRVLNSRSLPTLIGLSLLLLSAYALQAYLDSVRLRMLARIGAQFDVLVSPVAFSAAQYLPLLGMPAEQATQPIRDLDHIRGFLSSLGPTALFDMPWMPIFFAGCFLLHPWLGWLAMTGGLVILFLTWLTELRSRRATKAHTLSSASRQAIAEAGRRNAEAIAVMGMGPSMRRRWERTNSQHVQDWLAGSDATSGLSAFAKVFRMVLQSAVLGLGAYLAMNNEISGGAMIAASIMTSRALAPIEIAVAHWKSFVLARQSIGRLKQVLGWTALQEVKRTDLPTPCIDLKVDNLFVSAPGRPTPIVHSVSFTLESGQGLAIIGPSASGKSTLARALVGAWRPLKGEVRLDGASLDRWDQAKLGRYIGYMPQDIELFEGTIAENIGRFDPQATDEEVVAAAQASGAHTLILHLENGYDTRIGHGGTTLSGGQRQRIGLARALYGNPFLIVLDEPNSNLDHDGDEALTRAVKGVLARGGVAVVVTHRPTGIAGVDQLAMMSEGRISAIGRKEEILQKIVGHGGLPSAQRPRWRYD